MDAVSKAEISEKLRLLPSIDALIQSDAGRLIASAAGATHATVIARKVIGEMRDEIIRGVIENGADRDSILTAAVNRMTKEFAESERTGIRRVINATGVIVHTNLGRAPLSDAAKRALSDEAGGYCTVEYDLKNGIRGRRGRRAEQLLIELTGAEDALIVNNCASAAFLVLTVLAKGGEVIISRGELVEIGGDFRVPDVLSASGAKLREVGTTNRTKLRDYANAISDETRLLLKVHPSNYRIVGFTAAPERSELAALARERGIPFYEDAGSGALVDLSAFGMRDEPLIPDLIREGVDVVTFSGDKLLGSTQAGIVVGRRDLVERIRKHPLYRALRVSKLNYTALEATLESYRRGTHFAEIPVLRMLTTSAEELSRRTKALAERVGNSVEESALRVEVTKGNSVIGGGSAPDVHPETCLLSITHSVHSAAELESKLRASEPPLIARIIDDRVVLDLRTVGDDEENELFEILSVL